MFEKSQALLDRAYRVIPSATQTFSKGPNQWAGSVSPNYLERGDGAWVWDVDGNRYLDFLSALGPIVLGYNNAKVNDAVVEQLHKGSVFSQMHRLEVETAERLIELIPCAEMVRFGKNGSDATTAAVRAARAWTDRDHIACCGYHGWHDWFIGTTTRNSGVPAAVAELTHPFEYNRLDTLQAIFERYPGKVAAVIMEPVGIEPPQEGFLEGVAALAREHGALLVFDEVVTGFRFALAGAQSYFDVTPDLACFGKAMANGFPLSAITGRRDVMKVFDEIFFSGTFGGETLSLAACLATIDEIIAQGTIEHIWRVGDRLLGETQSLIDRFGLAGAVQLQGYAPRAVMNFPHADEEQSRIRRTFFMQECAKRGLLYFCNNMPTGAHGDAEIDFTLDIFGEVFPLFAAAHQADDFAERLEGEVVQPVFRKA